jgi:hypothetical protein
LTINEPEYQGDANILGDRTLACFLTDDGHFQFSTYNFKYNYGHDNTNSFKKVDHEDDLNDWVFLYFGYNRKTRTATAYARFRDREVTEQFEDHTHFIPKYFGFELGN